MYGRNELTPPEKESNLVKFMKTLMGGFQLLLWAGSGLSLAAYIAQTFQMDSPPSDNVNTVPKIHAPLLMSAGLDEPLTISALARRCTRRPCHCPRNLYLLPRVRQLEDYGLLYETRS